MSIDQGDSPVRLARRYDTADLTAEEVAAIDVLVAACCTNWDRRPAILNAVLTGCARRLVSSPDVMAGALCFEGTQLLVAHVKAIWDQHPSVARSRYPQLQFGDFRQLRKHFWG